MVSTVGRLLIEECRLALATFFTTDGGGGKVAAAMGGFGKLGILIGSGIGIRSPALCRLVLT